MRLELLQVEWLKLRRSLALLVTAACPLVVVMLLFAIVIRQTPAASVTPATWRNLWAAVGAMWCYFMLPLYVSLITALVNGNEHRNQTWRLMLTLPVGRAELYLAKAVTAGLLVTAANAALVIATIATLLVLAAAGYPTEGMLDRGSLLAIACIPLASLPVLVIQHALSWRMSSVVPPLALGVVATMGIVQVGSSKYWPYYPWSYTLVAANGTMPGSRQHALLLAFVVGIGLYVLSAAWLSRREADY